MRLKIPPIPADAVGMTFTDWFRVSVRGTRARIASPVVRSIGPAVTVQSDPSRWVAVR